LNANEGGNQEKVPWVGRRVAHTTHKGSYKQEHALILVDSTAGQLNSYPPPDTALYSYSYYKYQEKDATYQEKTSWCCQSMFVARRRRVARPKRETVYGSEALFKNTK